MANLSNYLSDKLIKHVFKATSYTMPTSLYLSLHTATPTAANDTSTEVGTSSTNYARQSVPPSSSANWTLDGGVSGKVYTAADVNFPAAGSAGYGTVTYAGIYDASTAGNLLFFAPLANSKVISVGDIFTFKAGDVVSLFS